jgi:hypothetical protein
VQLESKLKLNIKENQAIVIKQEFVSASIRRLTIYRKISSNVLFASQNMPSKFHNKREKDKES